MPNNDNPTLSEAVDMGKILAELEVPFPPEQVHWRVMNTSKEKNRGQIAAYADPRAYTDRLNTLFSPQGWTRDYRIETMSNITRVKKGETILTGKVPVTCTVTILGLGSHSGTGEEWADENNGMTSADAQAFKRACSCFGLGRYFYDFAALWVDLDQNRQPRRTPPLPAWAMPENWRKGMRPSATNRIRMPGPRNAGADGSSVVAPAAASQPGPSHDPNVHGPTNHTSIPVSGNADMSQGNRNGDPEGGDGNTLDEQIVQMEKALGGVFYRNILREYGRVNQPRLIRDLAIKRIVLEMLESATRGLDRLEAVTHSLDTGTLEALLTKLQVPPLDEIADLKTLQHVVFGLEELASQGEWHAA